MFFFMAIGACLLWKYNFLNRINNNVNKWPINNLINNVQWKLNWFNKRSICHIFCLCNINKSISSRTLAYTFLLQVQNMYLYDLAMPPHPPPLPPNHTIVEHRQKSTFTIIIYTTQMVLKTSFFNIIL